MSSLRRRHGPFLLVAASAGSTAIVRLAFAERGACGAVLRGGCAALPPQRIRYPPTLAVLASLPVLTVTPLPTTVPNVDAPACVHRMLLGASLRDRATLSSPLRGLAPSGGYPSRLRSLALTPRSAWPAARCARRRCRSATVAARSAGTVGSTAAVSSRRRCAPRSSATSPGSPWPAAPAAGIASARRGCTPCVAGAGFATHRAPHCAVQSCPHECGRHRFRLRQRAAHDCLRLRPHRPPLKRRGGSPPSGSPTSISQSPVQHESGIDRPGPGLGFTPDASLMQGLPWLPVSAVGCYAAGKRIPVHLCRAGKGCHRSVAENTVCCPEIHADFQCVADPSTDRCRLALRPRLWYFLRATDRWQGQTTHMTATRRGRPPYSPSGPLAPYRRDGPNGVGIRGKLDPDRPHS